MVGEKTQIYKGRDIAVYFHEISKANVIFTFFGHVPNPKNLCGDGFIQQHDFSGFFSFLWQTIGGRPQS